ncbi:hypothetical protein BA1379B_011960 [Bartonella sp. A1379B]|nr:hypothetical protein BA1379B_011960 [Bartonella sp. A1379B]AQX22220.1 hypothetical protein Bho11B_001900 [Bartonella sp. 11B]AQX24497.1 hypothetical protein Bho114_011860 [Bartonella sp. 114]AQX25989.1 hypothetical protein Bco22_013460 [Bartonella sp. Coyote22sub2]
MLKRRDKKITDLKKRLMNTIVIGKISHADHKNAYYHNLK